jgi:hypothetical protein
MLALSVSRREDALQGYAKIQCQIGLKVGVRLAAASTPHCCRLERGLGRKRPLIEDKATALRKKISGRRIGIARHAGYVDKMAVRGDFTHGKRMSFLAPSLALDEAISLMHGHMASQVRQRKTCYPVAAVSGSQKREKRLILIDRQELPSTKCPAFGGKTETEDSDFSKKRCGHVSPPASRAR